MSAKRNHNNIGVNDLQNPLFLHPSEGSDSLAIQEKLIGVKNFRSWKRVVEIGLATKRKLGFVQGIATRSSKDSIKVEMWHTSNSMGIAWLTTSVLVPIAKSILFLDSDVYIARNVSFTNMPNDRKAEITHEDGIKLRNGLKVAHAFWGSLFDFRRLSISKLARTRDVCRIFYHEIYVVQELVIYT
ncbi:hypothetical protein Cgig2_030035 [Carnegiea gigantea]|uniref:Retrotransposon Copia-like N-terminal domain-containing protein n=1 Tax=Carnegiea gigantea TaxID=171969 RepID=A0A9Q1K2J2_9CARY|nr:hypothetical protein Cgig2_030035 [Carnegiea gigantea]